MSVVGETSFAGKGQHDATAIGSLASDRARLLQRLGWRRRGKRERKSAMSRCRMSAATDRCRSATRWIWQPASIRIRSALLNWRRCGVTPISILLNRPFRRDRCLVPGLNLGRAGDLRADSGQRLPVSGKLKSLWSVTGRNGSYRPNFALSPGHAAWVGSDGISNGEKDAHRRRLSGLCVSSSKTAASGGFTLKSFNIKKQT